MDKKVLSTEKRHLKSTLQKLSLAKEKLERAMDALGKVNLAKLKDLRDDPVTSGLDFMMFLQQLHEKNAAFNIKDKVKRLEEYEYLSDEPYFARIDLSDSDGKKLEKVYIGKFGYTEKKPIITDWRAKIASVYYRYRYPQKNVKYKTKDEEVTKNLTLKRTFEIDRGELIKYYNNDIQFDESEIIVQKIGERTGGVLEDIIETIQESQLDIIESDPRKVCIVQGCVGSGKSTVAIHKLSHIFFNYPNIVSPERSILVTKSGILISYLATLFPKLGIFDINYKTLRELVINLLFREEIDLQFDLDMNSDLSGFTLKDLARLEKALDKVHENYSKEITKILESDDMPSYASYVYSKNQSVAGNIKEVTADLSEELAFQKEKLKENPKSVKVWIFQENIKNLKKIIRSLQKLRGNLKTKALKEISSEWGIPLKETLGYYEILIYLYIHFHLFGFNKSFKYQYCVIDEGQDFSILEYTILSKLVQRGRFCILGDLNQSFFTEGLKDWNLLKKIITEAKEAQTYELDTNYRSTKQIIDLANDILSPYTKDYLPGSIERLGKEPEILHICEINDVIGDLKSKLSDDIKKLDKSIGIICFDQEIYQEVEKLFSSLQKESKIAKEKLIVLDNTSRPTYIPKGVYLMTFADCKGLEFSKVYVLDAKLKGIKDFLEAKKLYVAVTRAMNELVVYSI